jgi:hypothetical protein
MSPSEKRKPVNATATLLSSAVAACVFSSCSTGLTVTTDFDRSAQFGRYNNYALTPPVRGQKLSEASAAVLRAALRGELARRGITKASNKTADLDVVPHLFIEKAIATELYIDWDNGYQGGWPSGGGFYNMRPDAPTTYADANQYHADTSVLDFVDARKKKLVFRGVATSVLGGSQENERIREAVAKIVAAYQH